MDGPNLIILFTVNGIVVQQEVKGDPFQSHISLLCFITLVIGGGHLRDNEAQLNTYIPNLDEFNIDLFELRDFFQENVLQVWLGDRSDR